MLSVLAQCFDGIALLAPGPWRVIFVNEEFGRLLHRSCDELCNRRLEGVFGDASKSALVERLDRLQQAESPYDQFEFILPDVDDQPRLAQVRLCRVDSDEQPVVALIVRPVAAAAESTAPAPARRDSLTDLPDRTHLFSRLEALLQGERAADRQFALLFVDLDNFKQVNDNHGHLVGDRVLRDVAQRLAACLRQGDLVTRFGGDEFVVLLENVAGREEIDPVVERIRAALDNPILLPEGEFRLSVSIGVAEAAPHHRAPDDVLREADRAMYAAKRGVASASKF